MSRRQPTWLEAKTLKKVAIHLDNDVTIEGLVDQSSEDGVMLQAATVHDTQGRSTEVEGETWVPRERIVFAQGL